jgi:predicted nucleotidyltransferase
MAELMAAFEDASLEMHYYLDWETGQVIMLSDEELGYVDEPPDYDLLDWQQEMVKQAKEIWLDDGKRYISVPEADSHSAYRDMEVFIATVEDQHLSELLWVAIRGRGAFRRFKDVLYDYPRERERWFEFSDAQVRRRVLDWLNFEGIEPIIDEPEVVEKVEPETPTDRELCLAEALAFVRQAVQMPGVERIALLGSLTTDKPDPKDVDLLVRVADDADLEPLAAAARRLQGHLQSDQLGADVFLADAQDRYLGRTCPWKRCGPGIRVSCDARHCGRRPYLHDDWDSVRLEDDTVRRPPIILWPQVIARLAVPEDVQQGLIQPLVDEGLTRLGGEAWIDDYQPAGRCARCQRQAPVLALGDVLTLCAKCLRQGANLLDLLEARDRGLPWSFRVVTDYHAGPVTWEDVYDSDGHLLFALYARGQSMDPMEPEAGVYENPGYYPRGYPGPEEGDGYPEIVAGAEALTLAHVAEACRQWMAAHKLPADGPLFIDNGPDDFAFAAPDALPTVTHLKSRYSAEELLEEHVTEYPTVCPTCTVQIISHEPHLEHCPWCGAEMTAE